MPDSSQPKQKLQFGIKDLLFVMLCVAGVMTAYRLAHTWAYERGRAQRIAQQPVAVVYDIADAVTYWMRDPDTGQIRPAAVDERATSTPDFDTLFERMLTDVHPESWADFGGPAAFSVLPSHRLLIVHQTPGAHTEIESLLRSMSEENSVDEN